MINPQAILQAIGSQVDQMTLKNWQPPVPMGDPLVDHINKVRAENKLSPLQVNQKLNNSATSKALNMVNQGYWQHTKLDGDRPWDSIKQSGYKYNFAGENLARGFKSNEDTMDAWMDSPSHKDNILNSNYSEIGIGRHKDANGHEYVVTHFGKPE